MTDINFLKLQSDTIVHHNHLKYHNPTIAKKPFQLRKGFLAIVGSLPTSTLQQVYSPALCRAGF